MSTAPSDSVLGHEDKAAVEALRAVVRIATVAHRDADVHDPEPFDDFVEELVGRVPLLHGACEITQHCGHALLLRWPGRGPAHQDATAGPVVLMAHSDVVPIDPDDDWQHPPFSADLADGFIWGRGTLDCKGSLIALCSAAERLLAEGFSPQRDIWFSFGCNEEIAGTAATSAIELLQARDVRPWFVLDEGGAVVDDGFPGMTGPIAMIGVAEKGLLDLELRAEAAGGHASTPTRGGATATLARAIVRLDEHPFPTNVPAATVAMLEVMATRLRAPLGRVLALLTKRPRLLAAALQRAGAEPAAMTRTTTAITQLRGSRGANVIATIATATVNLRIMIGETVEGTIEQVRRIVRDNDVTLTALSSSEPSAVAPVDEAFELLGETLAAVMPDVVPAPYVVMAATDGRFFQQSFPRVYRFNPFRMSVELRRTLHNVDERIGVADYLEGIRWYAALLGRL